MIEAPRFIFFFFYLGDVDCFPSRTKGAPNNSVSISYAIGRYSIYPSVFGNIVLPFCLSSSEKFVLSHYSFFATIVMSISVSTILREGWKGHSFAIIHKFPESDNSFADQEHRITNSRGKPPDYNSQGHL